MVLAACAGGAGEGDAEHPGARRTEMTIEEAQEAHTPEWLAIPGVVGTGIGDCDGVPCIRVFVDRATPEISRRIPEEIEGYRVSVVETGPFRAQDP